MATLAGYQIDEQLYESFRTVIYRGRRPADQSPVILKRLKLTPPPLEELIRLHNHYTIAAQLDSPGIVQPLALERAGAGLVLVMPDEELVALGDYFRSATSSGHAKGLEIFLAIAIQLADILDGLSQHHVIHNDIKPSHILIHPITGQVKLTDFGMASQLPQTTQELHSSHLFLEGALAYLSPEQTARMNCGIDYRSDFYSLGVTFYNLLTGHLPFASEDPADLGYPHVAISSGGRGEMASPYGPIPDGLSQIVLKLMAKNAEDRYQSAVGLKADLTRCLEHYRSTGAIAHFPLDETESGHPTWLTAQPVPATPASSRNPSTWLDLATVLKASQAISQEVQMDRFVERLMQVVMENTEAQTSTLILKLGDVWQITACCTESQVCQLRSSALDEDSNLPLSVIATVQRTQTSVVVDDVTVANPFDADPYWERQPVKSILCVPILRQNQQTGMLYLENRVTVGAFTRDRQEVVQIIAAQAAISLENARLYHTLEQEVEARAQELSQALTELRSTQQDLIRSEKMAALGQLTASIAHEINTPLGVILAATTNITAAFDTALSQLPALLRQLTPRQQTDFLTLIDTSLQQQTSLSTQAERQLRRTLQTQLEAHQIATADRLAGLLTLLRLENFQPYLSLCRDRQAVTILETAYNLVLQQQSASSIQQEVDRAGRIVSALRIYSYQNSAGEKSLVDLTESIEVALTLYQSRLKQGIQLIRRYDPHRLPVLCNPDELIQVWVNLIDNALDVIGQQGTLEIGVSQECDRIRVDITNSGGGIPTEIQAQMFAPFFTTKPRGEGSGLGLDIVRQLIQRQGGKICVESTLEHTTFTVQLPLTPE